MTGIWSDELTKYLKHIYCVGTRNYFRTRTVNKLCILANRNCSPLNEGGVRVAASIETARLQCRFSCEYAFGIRHAQLFTRDLARLS